MSPAAVWQLLEEVRLLQELLHEEVRDEVLRELLVVRQLEQLLFRELLLQ